MENKKRNCTVFRMKARRWLDAGWKIALVFIGIYMTIVIVMALYDECGRQCRRRSHYRDRLLSENICVHSFKNSVRVYDLKTREYVTPKLKWVSVTPERDSLTVFCDKDGMRGFLNVNTGETVIEGRYEYAWVFSEGLAAVVEPDGKMGFIDMTGDYVIEPELEFIPTHDYVFKHDVCCIENKNGEQGLISRNGEWVLPQEYSFIDYVNTADMFIPARNEKKGVLKNGSFEWLYPLEYDDVRWTDAPSGQGFILYKDFNMMHVSLDGTVINGFIVDDTSEMKYMTKYHSEEADEYELSDKVIAFRVHDLCGVMDKMTGEVIIPARYGSVEMVSESILKCSLEPYCFDDYVLFDLKGKVISSAD